MRIGQEISGPTLKYSQIFRPGHQKFSKSLKAEPDIFDPARFWAEKFRPGPFSPLPLIQRRAQWVDLLRRAQCFSQCFEQNEKGRCRLLFSYVKGILTESAEQGQWLLVDEINLASAECLNVLIEVSQNDCVC